MTAWFFYVLVTCLYLYAYMLVYVFMFVRVWLYVWIFVCVRLDFVDIYWYFLWIFLYVFAVCVYLFWILCSYFPSAFVITLRSGIMLYVFVVFYVMFICFTLLCYLSNKGSIDLNVCISPLFRFSYLKKNHIYWYGKKWSAQYSIKAIKRVRWKWVIRIK